MAREKGIFNVAANYEPLIGRPFDARQLVKYKSDLTDIDSWVDGKKYLYDGMFVSVAGDTPENNGLYILKNRLKFQEESSWVKLAEEPSLDKMGGFLVVQTLEERNELDELSNGTHVYVVDLDVTYIWKNNKWVQKSGNIDVEEIAGTHLFVIDGKLAVDATNVVEKGSTKLVTSGAVFDHVEDIVGDIEDVLERI